MCAGFASTAPSSAIRWASDRACWRSTSRSRPVRPGASSTRWSSGRSGSATSSCRQALPDRRRRTCSWASATSICHAPDSRWTGWMAGSKSRPMSSRGRSCWKRRVRAGPPLKTTTSTWPPASGVPSTSSIPQEAARSSCRRTTPTRSPYNDMNRQERKIPPRAMRSRGCYRRPAMLRGQLARHPQGRDIIAASIACLQIAQKVQKTHPRFPAQPPLGFRQVMLLDCFRERDVVLLKQPACARNLHLAPLGPQLPKTLDHIGGHAMVGVDDRAEQINAALRHGTQRGQGCRRDILAIHPVAEQTSAVLQIRPGDELVIAQHGDRGAGYFVEGATEILANHLGERIDPTPAVGHRRREDQRPDTGLPACLYHVERPIHVDREDRRIADRRLMRRMPGGQMDDGIHARDGMAHVVRRAGVTADKLPHADYPAGRRSHISQTEGEALVCQQPRHCLTRITGRAGHKHLHPTPPALIESRLMKCL